MDKVVRVVVVDDSAYMRKVMKEMLSQSAHVEVVGTARDGEDALEVVERIRPDVVTLDLIMPRMDGVTFLQKQMARLPIPVVVVSISSENGEMMLRALAAGAVEMVQKPTALASERIFELRDELIAKVTAAANARVLALNSSTPAPIEFASTPRARTATTDLIAIGISTGGPQALKYLIPQLPADVPAPIVIVIHMPVGYTALFAKNLGESSHVRVAEAKSGDRLVAGTALIAPAGQHLTFRRMSDGQTTVVLNSKPGDTLHRPSVDVMFQSAAQTFGNRVLGVVMTGMGSDGTKGAAWIKAQGGQVITEAEESCVVYGMPRSVAEAGLSDRSVPLLGMARAILEAV